MEWWKELIGQNYDWFWQMCLALGLTALAGAVWRMIRKRLVRLVASTNNHWDDVVLSAIAVPVN